jgi:hypothetical protein
MNTSKTAKHTPEQEIISANKTVEQTTINIAVAVAL